ncbi:hypothetical protein BS47DRAFT_1368475 [Hydnum rufescens UP504]|uniref:Uncharacterized protein n=1 Tax=Hydnum rufescens UP504 TaxID=1448309 RepID=A0A9P6DN39_9AGAM|nr:hypothetical protein BS47DRAFT_1368475 [Hydnum rufescens UP504]
MQLMHATKQLFPCIVQLLLLAMDPPANVWAEREQQPQHWTMEVMMQLLLKFQVPFGIVKANLRGPNLGVQICFTCTLTPTPTAFDILMAHPPIPLLKVKKRAVPPNPAHTTSLAPQGSRWAPKFTALLECNEGERLDAVMRSIVEETDKQQALLIKKEQELERLKKELESQ